MKMISFIQHTSSVKSKPFHVVECYTQDWIIRSCTLAFIHIYKITNI